MKKLLFTLSFLSCLSLSAQNRILTYTFNISNLSSLQPSVPYFGSEAGDSKEITSWVFTSSDGQVSLSFDKGVSLIDARIVRGMDGQPYLDVPRSVSMILAAKEGSFISGVRIPGTDNIGGLRLQATDPALEDTDPKFLLNDAQTYYAWPVDTKGNPTVLTKQYSSVTFMNGSPSPSAIHKIEVDYLPPRDILLPTSNIASNSVINAFGSITLSFDAAMQVTSDAQYKLTDANGNDYTSMLSASASGSTVTISASSPIAVDGSFTLTVEAGSFESSDGFRNQALRYNFTVQTSFDFAAISLEEGEVKEIPTELVITFDGEVGTVNEAMAITITDETGAVVSTGKAMKTGANSVTVTFDKPITENGRYTLLIAEGLVTDKSGKHFNSTKSFVYNIGDIASAELRAKASALLSMTGLGYPTSGNSARLALSALGPKASTADFTNAIADYLNSTDVELPLDGKFYYIASVAPNGQKLYLQYTAGQISLTTDKKSAVGMRAVADNGSFNFVTPDGKYLQQLGSSTSSVGESAATLTLQKLPPTATADAETVFGFFCIKGNLGSASAYAVVNVLTRTFVTNSEMSEFYFTETLSSAFQLELVAEQDIPEPADDFTYDFTSRHIIYYKEEINQQTPVKDVYLNDMTFFTYDDNVRICPSDKEVVIVNYNTNTEVARGRFYSVNPDEHVAGAKSAIKLKLNKEIVEGSLPAGTYTYLVYAGTFGDDNFGSYYADRAAFLASGKTKADCHANAYIYYILTVNNAQAGQVEPTPGPGEDDDHPSADILAKAKELLTKSGVGYPLQTASTRTTLQSLVNSNKGTDATFNKAMENYLTDTNVEMPANGQYYTIAAVSADASSAYLQQDGTLTFDAEKAGRFRAISAPEGVWFTTDDGKNLTVLMPNGCLTESFNPAANYLKLSRYDGSLLFAEKTFGLMTIQGINLAALKTSTVNVKTLTVTTKDNTAVFTNDESSAFRIALTTKPGTQPVEPDPVPAVEYTLTPDGGEVTGDNLTVTLTFTNISGVVKASETLILLTNGVQSLKPQSVTKNDDGTQFVLTFSGLTDGAYTLNIGAGTFTYAYNNRTEKVPAISSDKFVVTVKHYPSAKTMNQAKQALAYTGIGYPAAESAARLALSQLVASGEGTDEEFLSAIEAFEAETDIEKPATGKYYRVKAVGMTDKQTYTLRYAYLSVNENRLSLSSESSASVFQVTANSDGTTTLATVDGKYLALPATGDCLSEVYDAESHNLTLARLMASGIKADDSFGFISISQGSARYAVVDLGTGTVMTPQQAPCFYTLQTSGFEFEEVAEADIKLPEVGYALTPATGSTLVTFEKVTVSFRTNLEVKLKDITEIKLVDAIDPNTVYYPKSVTAVDGQENTFDIEFVNVLLLSDNRLCYLNIGSDAFVTTFMGRETTIREQSIVASYSIKKSITEVEDLETAYHLTWVQQPSTGEYLADADLNGITLKADAAIAVLTPATKTIIYKYSSFTPNATGHFEKTDDDTVVRLVLDSEIKEGSLSAGTYHLRIPAHTFGDSNYMQYLADHQSVSLVQCHVNAELNYTFSIDNAKATAITDVSADSQSSPVYDLMGRRVSGQLVPGQVYVRDGRKFTFRR